MGARVGEMKQSMQALELKLSQETCKTDAAQLEATSLRDEIAQERAQSQAFTAQLAADRESMQVYQATSSALKSDLDALTATLEFSL